MQLWEIIGLFVCVLAVIGFYTLACVVARCLSFREKMTVGVRVLEEDDADGVYYPVESPEADFIESKDKVLLPDKFVADAWGRGILVK